MQSGVGGWWRSGGRLGGCLSSPPSASNSLWAAVGASPGDPDGHTSSMCWSPPTCHSSAKQTHYQCRLLASHTCGSGRRGRLLAPTSPPFSPRCGAVSHSLPPCLVWGAYLSLCLCTRERTFLSEMLPYPRGN